jgi:hypothetical protein
MKRTICASGREGWTCKLQANYENNFEQFAAYDEIYGIAQRLGFETTEDAWFENPQIRGSTLPSDLEVVSTI